MKIHPFVLLLLIFALEPSAVANEPAADAPTDKTPVTTKMCPTLWASFKAFKGDAFELPERVASENVDQMRSRWAEMESDYYWHHTIDSDVDFLRFIRRQEYIEKASQMNGTEMEGVDHYLAWKKADDYLNDIPIGKLELSEDLFNKVRGLTTDAMKPWFKKFGATFPIGKSNPTGKVQELVQWYDQNKDKMDPVELAANFQYKWAAIYPSEASNSRASRLIMDRILGEHGLPPSLLEDSSVDIQKPIDQYVKEIRGGIDDYLTLAKAGNDPLPGRDPLAYGTMRNQRVRKLEKNPDVSGSSYQIKKEFSLGGKRLLFESDGFFYDHHGVPYLFHDGTLYPVPDRTYLLYGLNGKINPEGTRGLSEAQRDVFREHFVLLRRIKDGKLDPSTIQVAPYDPIAQANREGKIQLYPWQKKMFEEVIQTKSDDPHMVLSRTSKPWTVFELFPKGAAAPSNVLAQYVRMDQQYWEYLQAAKKDAPDLVSTVESERRKLHAAARKLLEPFLEARKALPSGDQEALSKDLEVFDEYLMKTKLGYADYDAGMKALGDDSIVVLRNDTAAVNKPGVGFKSQQDWLKTARKIPGFGKVERFIKAFDEFQKTSEGKKLISESLGKMAESAKKGEEIYKFLPKKLRDMATNIQTTYGALGERFLTSMTKDILKSPYASRGSSEDLRRLYVDLYLHGENVGSKIGKSFTSSPELLADGKFLDDNVSGGTFMVKVPRNMAIWQFANSEFHSEYEILTTSPLSRRSIMSYHSREDQMAPNPGRTAELKQFERKFDFNRTSNPGDPKRSESH